MPFDHYAATAPKSGELVPFPLTCLPGRLVDGEWRVPTLMLECLGKTNRTWMSAAIADANAAKKPGAHGGGGPVTLRAVEQDDARKRETVRDHVVRELRDVYHSDGRPATAADIAELCASLPQVDIDNVFAFARNEANWRPVPATEPNELAGK